MRATWVETALLATAAILVLATAMLAPRLYAQVAAPTPLPLTPPAAPGQPQPFATIGALPALLPAPGSQAAVPSALSTPRIFRCSCAGPGFNTAWVGTVASSNYTQAEQAATGQCIGYSTNANAPSPFIRPGVKNSFAKGATTGINNSAFNANGQIFSSAIVTAPVQAARGENAGQCSQCACN